MPNKRDKDKKLIGFYASPAERKAWEKIARERGTTIAQHMRDIAAGNVKNQSAENQAPAETQEIAESGGLAALESLIAALVGEQKPSAAIEHKTAPPPPAPVMVTTSISLSTEYLTMGRDAAEAEGRTFSNYISQIVVEELARRGKHVTTKNPQEKSYGRQSKGRTIKSVALDAEVAEATQAEADSKGISFSKLTESKLKAFLGI